MKLLQLSIYLKESPSHVHVHVPLPPPRVLIIDWLTSWQQLAKWNRTKKTTRCSSRMLATLAVRFCAQTSCSCCCQFARVVQSSPVESSRVVVFFWFFRGFPGELPPRCPGCINGSDWNTLETRRAGGHIYCRGKPHTSLL